MANVGEIFSKFFAYVLLVGDTNQSGHSQRSYEQIRADIAAILEQEKAAAQRQGVPEKEYQDACFAAVAWADETILKNVHWELHNRWKASPLQLEYFQTRNAGEEFFERLERLGPDQNRVREIYYVALGLGFTGRYFLGLEDELKLTQIRHEEAKHLPLLVEDVQDIDRLTPQPYEVPPPDGKPISRTATHLLVKLGILSLVVVPLLLLVAYKLWQHPSRVIPVPPAPPLPSLTEAEIRRQLGEQPCARIDIGLVGSTVNLGGRVASDEQGASIQAIVQRISGVSQVHETLQIIPRPFCEVLDVLEPFRQRSQVQGFDLPMILNKAGSFPTYEAGDNLLIDMTTPWAFDSYVYVDYYTVDGHVAHLLPNPVEVRHDFAPNSHYTVGKPGAAQRLEWKIQPPFGLELVSIIASKTPLFSSPRYDPEATDTYLTELRRVLPKDAARADVAVTFQFITTRDRQ
jgi:type IV/VI secretion system ImpK/VasF family protein